MDITTLLIIVLIVLLLGGGWYGHGRCIEARSVGTLWRGQR